jgi:hypothetical protein
VNHYSLQHIKHVLIAAGILVVVWMLGWRGINAYKDRQKEKDTTIQEIKQQAAQEKIAAIETLRQQQLADLMALAARPATVQTITDPRLLQGQIPTGSSVAVEKGADGKDQVVIKGDAQGNLNFIRDYEAKCGTCEIDLTAANNTAAQNKIMIDSLTKERNDFKALAIPRWTLTAAVSKTRDGGYKPAGLIDYRVDKTWGLTFGAVNNSLVGGISIHFGGTAKPSTLAK